MPNPNRRRPRRLAAGAIGGLWLSACLASAGCSGGQTNSAPAELGSNGLVELPADGAGKSSGPEVKAMTPGGKGPRVGGASPP